MPIIRVGESGRPPRFWTQCRHQESCGERLIQLTKMNLFGESILHIHYLTFLVHNGSLWTRIKNGGKHVYTMRAFTIRLDDRLTEELDKLKADIGVKNDAEAVRVIIREEYRRRFGLQSE